MANKRNGNSDSYDALRRARRGKQRRAVHNSHPNAGSEGGGMSIWLKLLAGMFILAGIAFFAAAMAAIIIYRSYADDLVAPDELAINKPSYGARILDRNGRLLYEYVDDRAGLRRPIGLDNVSEAFLAATIATEDDTFFSNPGVNIRGLARAAWENSPIGNTGGAVFEGSGGSSITQQLVKNVYIGQEEVADNERESPAIRTAINELTDQLDLELGRLRIIDLKADRAALNAELKARALIPADAKTANSALQILEGIDAKEEELQALLDRVSDKRQSRSVSRKVKETIYALELTNKYPKEKILEWYVNQISYGGVYNGIEAASQGYFGKPAKDLTLAEAAMMAGLPQSPAAYDPVNHPEAAIVRRNQVLELLQRQGRVQIGENKYYTVNREELAAALESPVEIAVKRFPIEAPHFVLQYVQPQIEALLGPDALYRDGLVVTTTLDIALQHQTQDIMEKWIREFEGSSQSRNGSMMIMQPETGEIWVMIGSRDYFREDIEGKNNNATACNSPGSSFKPFAYLTTFMDLGWGPGTVILDTPVTYTDSNGNQFTPTNPTRTSYAGPVTIRHALGNSLNIPANKAAAAVGADKIVANARKLGFMNTFRTQADGGCSLGAGYGPAIATGGVDVTLEEMMFGYSVLANGGIMKGQATQATQTRRSNERKIDPIAILKITDAQGRNRFDVEERRRSERVVPAEYVYLVTSVLTDSSAQCTTFGCGGISVPGRQAGVKTGTSEPYDSKGPNAGKIGETWAFGYTPNMVVGIWAGNSKNQPIVNIFSTSISFRSMRDAMQAAYDGRSSPSFTRPANVVDAEVCVPSGLKPTPLCGKTSKDLFAKDSVPTKEDDWWQRVRIDVRNGLLAPPGTPPQFIDERVALVLPPELLKTDEDKKRAEEWAHALNLPLAPTDTSTGIGIGGIGGIGGAGDEIPAIIYSPTAGQRVGNVVIITGRAYSTMFGGFRLEYGSGASPTTWNLLNQASIPTLNGPLGAWNVQSLPPGQYTLRLVVRDLLRGEITSSVTVQVGDGPAVGSTPVPGAPPLRP